MIVPDLIKAVEAGQEKARLEIQGKHRMNERIKELKEQAGITTNLDTDYYEKDMNKWVDYFSEKFAELIVRECAQLARDTDLEDVEGGDSEVLRAAKRQILEHFGVDE